MLKYFEAYDLYERGDSLIVMISEEMDE